MEKSPTSGVPSRTAWSPDVEAVLKKDDVAYPAEEREGAVSIFYFVRYNGRRTYWIGEAPSRLQGSAGSCRLGDLAVRTRTGLNEG